MVLWVLATFSFRFQKASKKQAREYFPLVTAHLAVGAERGSERGRAALEKGRVWCVSPPCPEESVSGQAVKENVNPRGLSSAPTSASLYALADVGREGGTGPPEHMPSSPVCVPHLRLPHNGGLLPVGGGASPNTTGRKSGHCEEINFLILFCFPTLGIRMTFSNTFNCAHSSPSQETRPSPA